MYGISIKILSLLLNATRRTFSAGPLTTLNGPEEQRSRASQYCMLFVTMEYSISLLDQDPQPHAREQLADYHYRWSKVQIYEMIFELL
jgi:hypothetical protein